MKNMKTHSSISHSLTHFSVQPKQTTLKEIIRRTQHSHARHSKAFRPDPLPHDSLRILRSSSGRPVAVVAAVVRLGLLDPLGLAALPKLAPLRDGLGKEGGMGGREGGREGGVRYVDERVRVKRDRKVLKRKR